MIAAEAIEIVVQYVVSSSQLYLFLTALPSSMLTVRLEYLRKLFMLFGHENEAWVSGGRSALWPKLNVPNNQPTDEILQKCISLYSSVWALPPPYNNPVLDGAPNLTLFIYMFNHLQVVMPKRNLCALELDVTILDEMKVSWFESNVHQLKMLNTTRLFFGRLASHDAVSPEVIFKLVKALTSLPTLNRLKLAVLPALPEKLVATLAKWSCQKTPTKLTIETRYEIYESFLTRYYKGCTPWLLQQYQRILEFDGLELVKTCLYQVESNVDSPQNLIQFVKSINLSWFGLCFTYIVRLPSPNELMPIWKRIAQWSKIRTLTLSEFTLSVNCCKVIATILPRLKTLKLRGNYIGDDGAVLLINVLCYCSRLTDLELSGQQLTDVTAIRITDALTHVPSLLKLSLCCNKITGVGMKALCQIIPRLEVIYLKDNKIGVDGALAIANIMEKTSHVNRIDISMNPLTYDGVVAIISNLNNSTNRLGCVTIPISKKELESIKTLIGKLPNQNWYECYHSPSKFDKYVEELP